MLEVFGWGALIVVMLFVIKELGKKFPIGCLLACIVFIALFVKACHDMNKEEEERKAWNENFQKHLKEIDDAARKKRN